MNNYRNAQVAQNKKASLPLFCSPMADGTNTDTGISSCGNLGESRSRDSTDRVDNPTVNMCAAVCFRLLNVSFSTLVIDQIASLMGLLTNCTDKLRRFLFSFCYHNCCVISALTMICF